MKSTLIAILLSLLAMRLFSQQRPPFSEKTVNVKDRTFLPFTKGEVVRKISGLQKPVLDEICLIITAWDSIAPPQGMKVFCYGFDNLLEIYFLPYLFEDGVRFASEGGPNLSIYANDPRQMFGSEIAPNIFLCPQRTADFNEFPVYQTGRGEATVICKKKIPIFIPVSQEEYLKALIVKEEKKEDSYSPPDHETQLHEMEQTYQKLLKVDKEAAQEFKQQMVEFIDNNDIQPINLVSMLKNELAGLTAEEKKRPAYHGGASAIEDYHNASGLVPYENRENADALVRPNPALIDGNIKDKIQLLVIRWSVGGNVNLDMTQLYSGERKGFLLADRKMAELYQEKNIWKQVFQMVK